MEGQKENDTVELEDLVNKTSGMLERDGKWRESISNRFGRETPAKLLIRAAPPKKRLGVLATGVVTVEIAKGAQV